MKNMSHCVVNDWFSLRNMDMFNKPAKRLRLDLSENQDNNDEFADWGGDDITAEEFDILEFQATQQVVEDVSKTFLNPCSSNRHILASEVEKELKNNQYELEGKVRLLTESVNSLSKNLREERLNRESIIQKKLDEFKERENALNKDVKKLESVLQFKEQEMKSLYDKMNALQNDVKAKPKPLENGERTEFLQRFKFETEVKATTSKVGTSLLHPRKFMLQVSCPKGETQTSELISTMLCNKLTVSQSSSFAPPESLAANFHHKFHSHLSAVAIADLRSHTESEELLDSFIGTLNCYSTFLKNYSCRTVSNNPPEKSNLLNRDTNHEQKIAVQALKDLAFFVSSQQFLVLTQKVIKTAQSEEPASSSISVNSSTLAEKLKFLLKPLMCLLHQDTYPKGYLKDEEMELVLAVLLSWSTATPESLISSTGEIPFLQLFSPSSSQSVLKMSLRLITNLCVHEGAETLIIPHRRDGCLMCSATSVVLQKVADSVLQSTPLMLAFVGFVSTCITSNIFSKLKLESSLCVSVVSQGILTSLQKYLQLSDISAATPVLRRGFSLLHLLSRRACFKERRNEDAYVSVVASMLALSKEDKGFKDFYDIAHELWDFQEDVSEFDIEDSPEDSS